MSSSRTRLPVALASSFAGQRAIVEVRQPHFTPTSCSRANAVESFFATLTRRRSQRGVLIEKGKRAYQAMASNHWGSFIARAAEDMNYRHGPPISLAFAQARIYREISETSHTGEAGKAAPCRRRRFGMSTVGQVPDQLSQGESNEGEASCR